MSCVQPNKAIEALESLQVEAETQDVLAGGEQFTAWKGKVRGVLSASLGGDDHLLERFDKVSYSLSMWTERTPQSAFDSARHRGVRNACGVIDAAIYHLRLGIDEEEPLDVRSFDPDLWEHVKNLVEDEAWSTVASQTAIFVEDQIRSWAGNPKTDKNGLLIGKSLMASVFGDSSEWRLGAQRGEHEGWRSLAIGFTQALSNVDRHRIQARDDARRYAVGVLGLGSLLLTQLRHEHSVLIEALKSEAFESD